MKVKKQLSRQRIFQKEYFAMGKCGYCTEHPPVFKGSKCEPCYLKQVQKQRERNGVTKPYKPQDGGKERLTNYYQKCIDKHNKWVQKYTTLINELNK